jgi:Ca2+-binding RTX toxin-like protein
MDSQFRSNLIKAQVHGTLADKPPSVDKWSDQDFGVVTSPVAPSEIGGADSASLRHPDQLSFAVLPADAPFFLAVPIPQREAIIGTKFAFVVPNGTFSDPESELTYTAKLADGSALPDWLKFDPVLHTFRGRPLIAGEYDIVLTATDGTDSASDTFELRVRETDASPFLMTTIPRQRIDENQPWSYQLPDGTFGDADDPNLLYRVTGNRGSALPYWIHFDPLTRTLSGTPPEDFTGTIKLRVIADDGHESATTPLILIIQPVDEAPKLVQSLQDHYTLEDTAFAFAVPQGSFADPNGHAITYTATLANGEALPSWLTLDPSTLVFSGTPPVDFNGPLDIRLIASNGAMSTSDIFTLNVQAVDDPPVLAAQTGPVHLPHGMVEFSFTLPSGTFTDVDSAQLTYTARQSNGRSLPSWLHFDAATQTFSGNVPNQFSGPISVTVTASDGTSSASETFAFTDSAPVLVNKIAPQTVGEASTWRFTVPQNTFADFDTAVLHYSASLADGSQLPSWLKFNSSTLTFSGTPPDDWSGHEDLAVTASDGTHRATDTFALDQNGDFSYQIEGSMWGKSAPSEINYLFDKLFFQTSNTYSAGFDVGFDDGGARGGVSAGASFGYALQAGLLAAFHLKPDVFKLTDSFDIHTATATRDQVIGVSPFVMITGEQEDNTSFTITTPSDAFYLHVFAGITASVSASLSGGLYAEYVTPDGLPNIGFSADFTLSETLPLLQAVTVANGDVSKPDGPEGGIDVTIKTGDKPFTFNIDSNGIGQISIGPPTGVRADGYDIVDVGANGLGTLVGGGTSAPFLSATLDLDQLAIYLVENSTGVDLTQLFHTAINDSFGPFYAGLNIDTDFALVGDLALKEQVYFTPQIYYTMTTSFGQTITGQAGDQTSFETPEGEGNLKVTANYTSQAELTTVLSLVGNIHFDYSILKASLVSGIDASIVSFSFPGFDLPALLSGSFGIAGIDIPLFSSTDQYGLAQTRTEKFAVPYEKFRTTIGSGDNFTLTTHQHYADGNENANKLIGNGADNAISGYGGDDTLIGNGGSDELYGGDGNDILKASSGFSYIDGGSGNDTITAGNGGGTFFGGEGDDQITVGNGTNNINGGAGNDTIKSGTGDDTIYDAIGVYSITDAGGNNTITEGNEGGTMRIAGNGNNEITSFGGDDRITTGGGNDTISSGGGNDTIMAGNGDNVIDGGEGDDTIKTGDGNDTITDLFGKVNITDTGGNNTVTLGDQGNVLTLLAAGSNVVTTGAGADTITLGDGDNTVIAGDGDDQITLGNGNNTVDGGAGNDVIRTGTGNDTITDLFGLVNITDAGGNNLITVGDQGSKLTFLSGNERIVAGSGNDTITTGDGDDNILTGDGNNIVIAGGGFNVIRAGSGNDTITGGSGIDIVKDFGGNDTITLGDGNNSFFMIGTGNAKITAGSGNDNIQVQSGTNIIDAGDGSNSVFGGSGNDTITTGSGADNINDSGGRNTITTGAGNDFINSGIGNDVINGGLGADGISGGGGKDIFVYASAADSTGPAYDTIYGFDPTVDRIDLPTDVTKVDRSRSGAIAMATFDHDLAKILNAGHFAAGHAVIVTATGELAGDTFLVIDANGIAGYQSGHDYVMLLASPVSTHIVLKDFN